jgi:hypothetical protein
LSARPAGRPGAPERAGAGPAATAPALVAVTAHAEERFRQRVRGTLDARAEITARVARAWHAGSIRPGGRATVDVLDLEDRGLVFVCRHDVPRGELVVVTLWEEGEARVPRRFTDALRR